MSSHPVLRERVLIIDDDPVSLEVSRERLEEAGYEVVLRTSAIGTSAAIQKDVPDLILLDVNMPGLKGPQLATILRRGAQGHLMSIILHSSRSLDELQSLANACGAIGTIQKTENAAKFLKQFEALSKRHRTEVLRGDLNLLRSSKR